MLWTLETQLSSYQAALKYKAQQLATPLGACVMHTLRQQAGRPLTSHFTDCVCFCFELADS